MEENEIKFEELKLSDKLAVDRTMLAENRTLLAWVRTALSLIGFGFTIHKILQMVYEQGATKLMREQTPRNIGLFMILTGTIPLFFMLITYGRTLKRLGRKESILKNPYFLTGAIICLLGILLVLTIVLNVALL
jgi:putative membrane protein